MKNSVSNLFCFNSINNSKRAWNISDFLPYVYDIASHGGMSSIHEITAHILRRSNKTSIICQLLTYWRSSGFVLKPTIWTRSWILKPYFSKVDQLDSWIMYQMKITFLPTIFFHTVTKFVSCGRDYPSRMSHNFVIVGAKLYTAELYLYDPWYLDQVSD